MIARSSVVMCIKSAGPSLADSSAGVEARKCYACRLPRFRPRRGPDLENPVMERSLPFVLAAGLAVSLAACETDPGDEAAEAAADGEPATDNPLLRESDLPYRAPAFDEIAHEDFAEALEQAMALHADEIDQIAEQEGEPSFDNTIVALERAGQELGFVRRVFSHLVGVDRSETLEQTQAEMAPRLSAHQDDIYLNAALFARVEALHQQREELDLDPESRRLLERYHTDFVRAGAGLPEADQERLREINARLAQLGSDFNSKVQAEVNDSAVVVEDRDRLAGLSDSRIESAADAARERGLEDAYLITLRNTSGQPPLSDLKDRELREEIHRASLQRGSRGNDHDTTGIVAETVALRTERARMLGYENHADYILAEQTAGDVATVNEMHQDLAPVGMANARAEAEDLQALIDETEDEPFELAFWDWAYYTEKLREQRYDFSESDVRPYLELNNILEEGIFYSAEQLFGIRFEERDDLPVWHEDVRVWEVFEEDGTPLGLMYGDFFSRGTKRGGAWMNSYRVQSGLIGDDPVVGIHINADRPSGDDPALLTWDETTTLFHEFGHAVHGLFSDVRYPRFSGTSVPRDFVEYPAQVFEMWAVYPDVLERYARHYETNDPMPEDLLERMLEAEIFNEGFRTTEYLAASILDQEWHQADPEELPGADSVMDFEADALARNDMDFDPVPPRYRTPYFSHMMGGYSAGYYSYIWSEVLDADSVEWFHEQGGLTRENGEHYRATILSSGGSVDPMELYEEFAGREPDFEALLERRGLKRD